MIIVRLQGGLGNQMFQYAFGRMLAEKDKTELKLDTTFLDEVGNPEKGVCRKYDLDIFCLEPVFCSPNEVSYFNGYPRGTLFRRLLFKLEKLVAPRNLVVQNGHEFKEEQLALPDNTCVVGRWQSERYFKDVAELIRQDYSIKKNWLLRSDFHSQIAQASTPVSVHVRREDYLLSADGKPLKRDKLPTGMLDISYYQMAISRISTEIENPDFFVFSEDIQWAMANLKFIPNATFVITEKSKKGMAEDLELISLCKHHIISNSTFSWWGAYLSKNPAKRIVAPKSWTSETDFLPPFIIPPNWIRI